MGGGAKRIRKHRSPPGCRVPGTPLPRFHAPALSKSKRHGKKYFWGHRPQFLPLFCPFTQPFTQPFNPLDSARSLLFLESLSRAGVRVFRSNYFAPLIDQKGQTVWCIAMKLPLIVLSIASILLVGCTSGVVPIGPNTYMLSGSSPGLIGKGTVEAKLFKQANDWCQQRGLVMIPIDSTGNDAIYMGNWANAEIKFKALPPGQAANVPSSFGAAPNQVIETRQR